MSDKNKLHSPSSFKLLKKLLVVLVDRPSLLSQKSASGHSIFQCQASYIRKT